VTNFWAFSPEKESGAGAQWRAAAKGGPRSTSMWSTLEDTRKWVPLEDDRMPTLMGVQGAALRCARARPTQIFGTELPVTYLVTSFYWDNFIHFGMGPKKGRGRQATASRFPMGDKKLPGIAAEDIGRCAYGIFKRGEALAGKTVAIAGSI
jgi:hypothetical protein